MNPREFLTGSSLLSERVRLSIMATVAAAEKPMDFNSLLAALDLSKGNLSSHVKKLEEAGLLEVRKGFVGRKPRTEYVCTEAGRTELRNYLEALEALLKGALQ